MSMTLAEQAFMNLRDAIADFAFDTLGENEATRDALLDLGRRHGEALALADDKRRRAQAQLAASAHGFADANDYAEWQRLDQMRASGGQRLHNVGERFDGASKLSDRFRDVALICGLLGLASSVFRVARSIAGIQVGHGSSSRSGARSLPGGAS